MANKTNNIGVNDRVLIQGDISYGKSGKVIAIRPRTTDQVLIAQVQWSRNLGRQWHLLADLTKVTSTRHSTALTLQVGTRLEYTHTVATTGTDWYAIVDFTGMMVNGYWTRAQVERVFGLLLDEPTTRTENDPHQIIGTSQFRLNSGR